MGDQRRFCRDLFWRLNFLTLLKKYKWVNPQVPGLFPSHLVLQLDQRIQEIALAVPSPLRLRVGTDVALLADDGVYGPGCIVNMTSTHGRNCIYTSNDGRLSLVDVPMWICRVQSCVDEVLCHYSQMRPVLGSVVDVVSFVGGNLSVEQEDMLRRCRQVWRGCEVTTVDGLVHQIVVNDLELMVFIDSGCSIFNYFKVRDIGDSSSTARENVSLVAFTRKLVWIAGTYQSFDGSGDAVVHIAGAVEGVASAAEKRRVEIEGATDAAFSRCSDILKNALDSCDRVLDGNEADERRSDEDESALVTDIVQVENINCALANLGELLRDIKVERKSLVEDALQAKTSLRTVYKEINSVVQTAKIRVDAVFALRRQFLADVTASVSSLRNEFFRIGRSMEEHVLASGNDDTISRALQAVCDLKDLVQQRETGAVSSEDVISELRAVMQQFDMWEDVPAETVLDMGLMSRNTQATPFLPTTDESTIPSAGACGGRSAPSGGDGVDDSMVVDEIVAVSQLGNMPLAVPADSVASMHVDSTTAASSVTAKHNASSSQPTITSPSRNVYFAVPFQTYDERQPAMAMRVWGDSYVVEYHFLKKEFMVTADVREGAVVAGGPPLPNAAPQHRWLKQIRLFCNYVMMSSLPIFDKAGILLIPKPDPSPVNTVADLMKKQPIPLRSALDRYVAHYNPPDSSTVLEAMLAYVGMQRKVYDAAYEQLKSRVDDCSLIAYLR